MNDLIFAGIVILFFVVSAPLRPLLRKSLGGPHGNHHCWHHRAVAVRLFVRRHDSAGEILRNRLWKLLAGFNSPSIVVALALITKPMGLYLMRVLDANGRTWLDPVLRPLERLTYRVMGVDSEQGTRLETIHARHAAVQPGGLPVHLRDSAASTFAAAESARTRRRESRISPSTRRSASPPTPIGRATAANRRCRISRRWSAWPFTISSPPPPASPLRRRWCAASRGTRRKRSAISGWTWCASTYYLLLPICLVFAVFLVSQGMIQNFKPYTKAKLVEP